MAELRCPKCAAQVTRPKFRSPARFARFASSSVRRCPRARSAAFSVDPAPLFSARTGCTTRSHLHPDPRALPRDLGVTLNLPLCTRSQAQAFSPHHQTRGVVPTIGRRRPAPLTSAPLDVPTAHIGTRPSKAAHHSGAFLPGTTRLGVPPPPMQPNGFTAPTGAPKGPPKASNAYCPQNSAAVRACKASAVRASPSGVNRASVWCITPAPARNARIAPVFAT